MTEMKHNSSEVGARGVSLMIDARPRGCQNERWQTEWHTSGWNGSRHISSGGCWNLQRVECIFLALFVQRLIEEVFFRQHDLRFNRRRDGNIGHVHEVFNQGFRFGEVKTAVQVIVISGLSKMNPKIFANCLLVYSEQAIHQFMTPIHDTERTKGGSK